MKLTRVGRAGFQQSIAVLGLTGSVYGRGQRCIMIGSTGSMSTPVVPTGR